MKTRDLLTRILSKPTAPFRENWVAQEIISILNEQKIPYFQDDVGNIIAGVKKAKHLKRGFGIGLMAHMDHPGFHIDKKLKSKNQYSATFWGGGPFQGMNSAKVRIYSPHNEKFVAYGKVKEVGEPHPKVEGRPLVIEVAAGTRPLPDYAFGRFDIEAINIVGDEVRTHAADDLVGCVIALGALIDEAKSKKSSGHLFAIFTRAEEVGFIGCLALLEEGLIHKNNWIVSLEASRELPEAELGKGPVLRTGDKSFLFDPELAAISWKVAQSLEQETKKSDKQFIFQRRLMSGGTCEATPLSLFGFPAAGLAVPLRNYHNIGKDLKPASEIVSLNDTELARWFCVELARRVATKPDWRGDMLKEIRRDYKILKKQLRFKVLG